MSSYVIVHYLIIYLSFFISFRLNCSVGSSDMDLHSSLLCLDIFLSFEISIKALRVVVTEHYKEERRSISEDPTKQFKRNEIKKER